jgi:hypothetical protein
MQTAKQIVSERRPGSYSTSAHPEAGYVVRDPWFCEIIGRGPTPQMAWVNAAKALAA